MRKKKGRNPNGLGSLEELPSGKVRLITRKNSRKVTGPAVEKVGTYLENLKAATQAYEDLHKPKPEAKPTLAKFLQERLDGDLERELAPRTHDLYQRVFDNHILGNPFGKKRLDALTVDDVEAWKNYLLSKMSATSAQRYMQFVASQMKIARRLKGVANPFDDYKLPSRTKVTKDVLSKSRLAALYKLPWNEKMQIAVRLMGHGLRKSEACGLMYEDFDGEGITVQRQAIEVAGELRVLPLKTQNSYRWVPVDAELKRLLKRKKTGWVLEGAKGKPLRGRTLHGWWKDTVKGTEFQGTTPHDLRSTFGMLLLEAQVDVRTASEMLGHSPEVLARIYARSRKEVKLDALQKLANLPTKRPTKAKKTA